MSADKEFASDKELKDAFRATLARIQESEAAQHLLVRDAIIKAQNRHGGLRPASRALKIDAGYLQRLKSGEKTNPSDDVLRKLRLK